MIPDLLTLVFWVRLPVAVARLSPAVASVLMDGVYLVRGTLVGAGAPLLAVLLGLLAGARHSGATFVASLLVMGVLAAIGMLGAHLGLLSTLGYVIGDLVIRDRARAGPLDSVALLFSHALLALLTVYLPLVVGAARLWARKVYKRGNLPLWVEMAGAVAVAAVGVSAWSLAVRVLIRPAYDWQGIALTTLELDVAGLARWWVLVLVAAVAAAFRVRREHTGRGEIVGAHVTEVRSALERRIKRVAEPALPASQPALLGIAATLFTILVAGLIDGLAQGVLVLVFFAALLWGRAQLAGARTAQQGATRTPALLRGAVAAVVGYGTSAVLLATADGSWPELLGTCLTIALLVLATAQPAARRPRLRDAGTDL